MNNQEINATNLYEQVMNLAESAFLQEKKEKNAVAAKNLYEKAYELERAAAMLLLKDYEN